MIDDKRAADMSERQRNAALNDCWTQVLRATEEKGAPLTREEEDRVIDGYVRWDGQAFRAAE